jgi:hypothetical protein
MSTARPLDEIRFKPRRRKSSTYFSAHHQQGACSVARPSQLKSDGYGNREKFIAAARERQNLGGIDVNGQRLATFFSEFNVHEQIIPTHRTPKTSTAEGEVSDYHHVDKADSVR